MMAGTSRVRLTSFGTTMSCMYVHWRAAFTLGLLLTWLGVEAQVVVRPEGDSLRNRISPAWWLDGGFLVFGIRLTRDGVPKEHVDARGHLQPRARLRVWQRALQTGGAADVACVATALGLTCFITVGLEGDPSQGVFPMMPGQGPASVAGLRARLLHE